LTLVAARAVADAIGPEATIKDPNDVLVDGRKVAGILAEATGRMLDGAQPGTQAPALPAPAWDAGRVVLGIGINVGGTAWPGAGWVERDRLELLVDVLERLERGYDAWLSPR
jgi:biotin-(acetyl-CoA carboxylase) ligase